MRIAFDGQIFAMQQFGGISRYFASTANELQKMPGVSVRIIAPLHINAYLNRLPGGIVAGWQLNKLPRGDRLVRAAGNSFAGPLAHLFKPDVVHETYYSPIPSWPLGARHVVTVYDMIHEKFPSQFMAKDTSAASKRLAIMRANHVFCISEQTRRDLLEFYPLPEEKVSVTYLGYDAMAVPPAARDSTAFRRSLLGADAPYLLYVGWRQGYKNFDRVLTAYAESPWLRQNFFLACVGGGVFREEERSRMMSLGIASRVVQTNAGDEMLALCYHHAAAFVYPSMYEGFGIPPLEAMSLGCPVACSNSSSIPEVVGDAAELFDPADVDSIRTAIERILRSESHRIDLIARGHRQRALFSWQRCAQETAAVYRRLLV